LWSGGKYVLSPLIIALVTGKVGLQSTLDTADTLGFVALGRDSESGESEEADDESANSNHGD
jgi:hypothetical protein